MKQITLLIFGLLLCLPFISFSQIGEFEGKVRITDGASILELYDSVDDVLKGRLREASSNILLE